MRAYKTTEEQRARVQAWRERHPDYNRLRYLKTSSPSRRNKKITMRDGESYSNAWKRHNPEKYNSYLDKAKLKRKELKEKLIAIFGGKCELCGYDKYYGALDFDHLDPNTKSFEISKKICRKDFNLVLAEAKKCRLLCANCHREQVGMGRKRKYQVSPSLR